MSFKTLEKFLIYCTDIQINIWHFDSKAKFKLEYIMEKYSEKLIDHYACNLIYS